MPKMGSHARCRPSLPGLFLPLLLLLTPSAAAPTTKPYINSTADYSTECKTCPHSLCTNKQYYISGDSLNATCWTRGTKIAGDTLWLRTEAGCYVTQYDIAEYDGDYTAVLEYCGKDSEGEDLTEEDGTLQYKTECRICPDLQCDVVAYLPEETDVTLTCWTDEGQTVIDDPIWLKTRNNCYVAEIGLYSKPDTTYLDNCGPIPFLEIELHNNENVTSEVDKRNAFPEPVIHSPHYLINVTVGEDFAYCRDRPDVSGKIEKRYPFNSEVWLQCLVENNGTWWSETTDFCYVKNSDFWESPEGDYYRNPLCAYFGEPPS
ncbi:hypothetical protein GQ43DRAFT_467031 [Delitschia confertaspora ATCC 74209]|uniref:Sushi domain-containing protein n=1 Tax=Delitschia confertaspora ATCC 74209 TaxID=1513339 RepID=A0A9P4JCA2_9PLEO|nr:hypothetical protein GQ43DRAFT_467031 [Delitschia confertaspora ATCC 74209]